MRDFPAKDVHAAILAEFPDPKDSELRSEFGNRSRKHAVVFETNEHPWHRFERISLTEENAM